MGRWQMRQTQIIAFYLPQFHETEDNNQWWGKGFTEWTNVKTGKPLYKNHYQPKVPLNSYYYDLSNSEIMKEQAKLAKKYGVDGFCFYHYWFCGKKMLYVPLENLLNNLDINIPFCLSWANETWSKRWDGDEKTILIKQEYGGKDEWESHLQYLLKFFSDKRYICVDGKPVLLIYRAFDILNCREMVVYWECRLKEEGFNGIYIVETLNGMQTKSCVDNSDALVEFEPMYTIRSDMGVAVRAYRYLLNHMKLYRLGFRDYINYEKVWKRIIDRKRAQRKKIFYGGFPAWDNVARRGKAGLVVRGSEPEKFKKYLKKLYEASCKSDNEFLFINAWNEWGEGAYLEADEKNGFGYLEAIKYAKENENEDCQSDMGHLSML